MNPTIVPVAHMPSFFPTNVPSVITNNNNNSTAGSNYYESTNVPLVTLEPTSEPTSEPTLEPTIEPSEGPAVAPTAEKGGNGKNTTNTSDTGTGGTWNNWNETNGIDCPPWGIIIDGNCYYWSNSTQGNYSWEYINDQSFVLFCFVCLINVLFQSLECT